MMRYQEHDAFAQSGVGRSVSRKHQIDVVRVHLPQALQELLEGVVRGEPRRNRRRYALQHVVADDHELAVGLVQADMPRIVSWRFDHLERETSGAQHVALVQVDEIGLARQRQQLGRYVQAMLALAEHESALLRRRRLAQQGAEHVRLHLHEILHLFERVEVRIHAHTVAVDPIEIARMVGMRMRQDDLDGVPGSPEGFQRLVKRLLACRVVEANVDDRSRLVTKDDVGVQRLQGVMGKRHAHAVEPGADQQGLAERQFRRGASWRGLGCAVLFLLHEVSFSLRSPPLYDSMRGRR